MDSDQKSKQPKQPKQANQARKPERKPLVVLEEPVGISMNNKFNCFSPLPPPPPVAATIVAPSAAQNKAAKEQQDKRTRDEVEQVWKKVVQRKQRGARTGMGRMSCAGATLAEYRKVMNDIYKKMDDRVVTEAELLEPYREWNSALPPSFFDPHHLPLRLFEQELYARIDKIMMDGLPFTLYVLTGWGRHRIEQDNEGEGKIKRRMEEIIEKKKYKYKQINEGCVALFFRN